MSTGDKQKTELQSGDDSSRPVADIPSHAVGGKTSEHSFRQFKIMIDRAGEEAYLIRPDGSLVYVNKAAAQSLGYTVEEMLHLGVPGFDPIFGQKFREHFEDLKQRDIPPFETIHIAKGGRHLNKEVKSVYLRIDEDEYVCAFVRDITERKRTEEALRESETRFRDIVDNASVWIWETDRDLRHVYTNLFVTACLGYQPDEFLAADIFALVHPEDHEALKEAVRGATTGHKGWAGLVLRWRHKDGSWRHIESSGTASFGPDGNLQGLRGVDRDITDRKKAEDALREAEWKFRALFENSPIGVAYHRLICDESGKPIDYIFIDANDNFKNLTGVDPRGKRVTEAFPGIELDPTNWIEKYGNVVRTGMPMHIQQYLPLNDQWYDVIGFRYAPDHFAVAFLNITDKARAEKALRESEERLRLALTAANQGLYDLDIRTGKAETNPEYALMLGYDPATFRETNQQWIDRLHPDDREPVAGVYRAYVKGEVPEYKVEFRQRTKSGEWKWILSLGKIIERDEQGQPLRMLGTHTDITARKQTEELLRASEKKFSAIFSLTPDPTAITDIETGRIIDLNHAFEQLTGRPREELIGMTTADLRIWADLSDRDRMLRVMSASGEVNDMAFRLRRRDGEIREALFSARIIEVSGNRYLLGRSHDINEVKRAEEEKRELERQLMQAHRIESLGGLAGGIAHDFNNLLQGIFGYISMAKMTIHESERALSMLDQAEKALHQSVSLSTQLLTFSKGGKPVRKKLALGPVVENTVKFALSGSRVDYKMDVDGGLWLVEADEGQIGQVIQNLVINADQAMPMGGRIVITAGNVQAPGENIPAILPQGSYVRISVQDSGIGIPAQYLERIFDPYFTTKEKGSGLGLAISYSIVRNHGGTIHVASEVGKGSTISVYLPATAETQHAAPAPEKVRGQARKGKILIMDDEAMVRNVAKAMITTLRHEVECAEHGEEAVMKYLEARKQGAPFDIVILDLTVRGGMGGADTIKKLRKIDPKVKAVVSSGYADDSVIADYQSYGFCATLGKPYTMKALSNTLETLLAS